MNNRAPVVSLVAPAIAVAGEWVRVNLSASTDDKGIKRGTLEWGDGAVEAFKTTEPGAYGHRYAAPGAYDIVAILKDAQGASGTAQCSIVITEAVPPPDPTPEPTPVPDPAPDPVPAPGPEPDPGPDPIPVPVPDPVPTPDPPPVTADPHGWFAAAAALPQALRAYPLRSQAEIDARSPGVSANPWVTYDPGDDAACVRIPAWGEVATTVAADLTAEGGILTVAWLNLTHMVSGRQLRIGDEILTIHKAGTASQSPGPNQLFVLRGQFGTIPAAHPVDTPLYRSNNSLPNQVRLPIRSTDGHTYVIAWDAKWDRSWLGYDLGGYKAFQISDNRSQDSIFLETRSRNDGRDASGAYPGFDRTQHVGVVDVRSYNTSLPTSAGSNVTDIEPLTPQAGRFLIYPDRWLRFVWEIRQVADGFDLATLWVADTETDPVKVIEARTIGVRGTPPTLYNWWIEMDTSKYEYWGRPIDRVLHVRNVLVLQDLPDLAAWLQRPV